jgi:hypothetical protein
LTVHLGVGNDEFDGLLVGTNSTVGTKTPEDALLGGGWKVVSWLADWESSLWLVNTDSEAVLWLLREDVLDDGINVLWSEVFAGDTITAADGFELAFAVEGRDNIAEEWFVVSSNFVDFVENADLLDSGWKKIVDELSAEWAVEVDLE